MHAKHYKAIPILSPTLQIPGYSLYQFNPDAPPLSNMRRIHIIMYISDSLNSKEFTGDFHEQLWVKVEFLNDCYLIYSWYHLLFTI